MEEDLHGGLGLNLGCGKKYWPGWINVDLYEAADLQSDTKKLPYEDNVVHVICAIHLVEHLYAWEVPDILKEWKRVLKVDGKLILELPCLDKIFTYIAQCIIKNEPMKKQYSLWALWGEPFGHSEGMAHRWGYTIETMTLLLEALEFRNIKCMQPKYHLPFRDMRFEAIK